MMLLTVGVAAERAGIPRRTLSRYVPRAACWSLSPAELESRRGKPVIYAMLMAPGTSSTLSPSTFFNVGPPVIRYSCTESCRNGHGGPA